MGATLNNAGEKPMIAKNQRPDERRRPLGITNSNFLRKIAGTAVDVKLRTSPDCRRAQNECRCSVRKSLVAGGAVRWSRGRESPGMAFSHDGNRQPFFSTFGFFSCAWS